MIVVRAGFTSITLFSSPDGQTLEDFAAVSELA